MTRTLVLNAGSSTIKFRLYDEQNGKSNRKLIAKGSASKLGSPSSNLSIQTNEKGKKFEDTVTDDTSHVAAFKGLMDLLGKIPGALNNIKIVGHRIVHGGPNFAAPLRLTHDAISALDDLSDLAPLHNHPSVMLVKAALEMDLLKGADHVAVFDTHFHQTMPEMVWRYPLPYDACEESGLRKYGFHGTSHAYVARQVAEKLSQPLTKLNLITLHLGNGASACAIKAGKSFDTSMGFTPLEGLMMGTRSGDIDPSAPYHISSEAFSLTGRTPAVPTAPKGPKITKVEDVLNHESGLRGICGESDLQKVVEMANAGDAVNKEKKRRAKLALDMFCYRIQKYVGAYHVAVSGADAIVFTGGIGEHSKEVRSLVCQGLKCIGVDVDDEKNNECDVTGDENSVDIGSKDGKL
ncbi:acetate kinase [Powellomyces hirtus]|uniref:Probable acetate kinase n=1 Tax=Powellomyces hirtus TaxID=109895 RepID=A0A507DYC3_9FUNG|nr:acetate kinase [Powellomyces hirtus]